MAGLDLSKAEEDRILKGILDGSVSLHSLPMSLYNKYGENLTGEVLKAFNLNKNTDLTLPDHQTPRILKKNIYKFSAAKTFNNVKDMQNFIFDDEGMKRSFSAFKKEAAPFFNIHNEAWLETEAFTASRMAEGANEWDQIQSEKDTFPFIRYETVLDKAVRSEHKALHGVVKAVDDPFWDTWMPPNGWNCRCFTTQQETGTGSKKVFKEPDIEPLFAGNAGKSGQVFKETGKGQHPYFKVATNMIPLKKRNFNLPMPKDVVKAESKISIKPKPKKTTPLRELSEKENVDLRDWKRSLSKDEKDNINYYTGVGFRKMNDRLRFKKSFITETETAGIDDRIKMMSKSLDTAPKYKGKVYRGMEFESESPFSNLEPGQIISDKGFMSSTRDEKIARNFLAIGDKKSILFEIESKNGVSIKSFSSVKLEEEVLFNAGTAFEVAKIEETTEFTLIKLSEI